MARAASASATYRRSTGGGGSSGAGKDQAGHREAWASPEEAESRTCPICLHVPRDAVAHSCGELFCELCWTRLGAKPRCPSCRSDTEGASAAHRDRRAILNLMVFCPRECQALFRLGSKQSHLDKDCLQRPVPCPLCNIEVRADVLEDHTLQECVHREIGCPDCGMITTPHGLHEHQRDDCPYRRVPCQLCGDSVQWKDMNVHLTAEAGKHLAALIKENSELRKDSVKLESEISGLKQADDGLRKEITEMRSESAIVRHANEGFKKEISEMRLESAIVRHANEGFKKEISKMRDDITKLCTQKATGWNNYCVKHMPPATTLPGPFVRD